MTTAFLTTPLSLKPRRLSSRCLSARSRQRPALKRIRAVADGGAKLLDGEEHARYLRDVAHVKQPPCLKGVLHVLEQSGEHPVAPRQRGGLHPFLVPLTRTQSGETTGFLRWPTAPDTMEMPIVRTVPNSLALNLVAPSATALVARAHASADYAGRVDEAEAIRTLSPEAELVAGEVMRSEMPLERFLVLRVGKFPDVFEGLAEFHLAKGDESSALVTCERANTLFPGWASPHVFHTLVLKRLGRECEMRDAARFTLQMPLWTMGGTAQVREMGRLAGYADDSSLEKIYQRLFEDKREKEVQEGKAPQQVALDRAAYFLDWMVARGERSWEDVDLEKLAELYDEANLGDVATFVRY